MMPVTAQNRRSMMALAMLVGLLLMLYIGPRLVEADQVTIPLGLNAVEIACANDENEDSIRIWEIENPNQEQFSVLWESVGTTPPVTGTVEVTKTGTVSDPTFTRFTTTVTTATEVSETVVIFPYSPGQCPPCLEGQWAVTPTVKSTSLSCVEKQGPDLRIDKEGPEEVDFGTQFLYKLTVTNLDSDEAAGVVVTDTLPPGLHFDSVKPSTDCGVQDPNEPNVVTCNLESLVTPATVKLFVTAVSAGTLTNTAEVFSPGDPNPDNNVAKFSTKVRGVDLSVEKESPAPVFLDDTFSYTLNITNLGPDDAPGVVVTDILPEGMQFASVSPANDCGAQLGDKPVVVTCEFDQISKGGQATVELKVKAITAGAWTNEARVSSPFVPDTDASNNVATVTTEVFIGECFGYQVGLKTNGGFYAVSDEADKWSGDIIVGSNGRDTLNGDEGPDLILGRGGDDRLRGRQGNDIICGGSGNDNIWGNQGNDILIGGTTTQADDKSGRDNIRGDSGNDIIYAGDEDDRVNGHNGEDEVHGGAGNDRLDGSNHDDILYGDEGPADYLIGGNGIDSGEDADGARLKSVENFDGKEITDKSDNSKKPKKSKK